MNVNLSIQKCPTTSCFSANLFFTYDSIINCFQSPLSFCLKIRKTPLIEAQKFISRFPYFLHLFFSFSDAVKNDKKIIYFSSVSTFKNACGKNGRRCNNNGICQAGFTDKGYRCLCNAGFRGEHCEEGERLNAYLFVNNNE